MKIEVNKIMNPSDFEERKINNIAIIRMKLHIDPSAGKICDLQKRNTKWRENPKVNKEILVN